MDYEKKYKEALEKAREYNFDGAKQVVKDLVTYIFPELKESEDEKIRKEIIELVKFYYGSSLARKHTVSKDKMVAWLEKQGESDETKTKIFLINKGYPIDANGTFPTYEEIYNIIIEGLEHQGEQKPIINVPPRDVILAIWDLGNELKELTNGSISTEYGTQLDYIQKHWHESEYYLKEKLAMR